MEPLGYIAPWVLGSVAMGILVGYLLSGLGRSAAAESTERERRATLKALVELLKAVEQMNGDVECHNSEIRQQADHVGSLRVTGAMEDVQQALLAHMVSLLKSNQRLQNDLTCTRYRMEEQAQEIDHARREARTDALTTVANRKACDEKVQMLMAEWDRDRTPFVLILADLDHLKRINDSHGHPAGDHVLKKVGSWLKQWVRGDDFVGRYGGDEFVILLPHTELQDGVKLAEELRAQTADRASGVTFRGELVSLSLSIGVASPRMGDTVELLIHRVDQALLKSKRCGRNQVTCEDPAEMIAEDPLFPLMPQVSASPAPESQGVGCTAAWGPAAPSEGPAAFLDF